MARDYLDRATVHADGVDVAAAGDVADLDSIRRFAVAWLRREQDLDLRAFGVGFDVYFLESSLYSEGRVDNTVRERKAAIPISCRMSPTTRTSGSAASSG